MKKFILDEVDHQILDVLIENARTPFTDIAKKLSISAGTVHVRVKKMEDEGVIQGSTLTLDYQKLGYTFIAYIGVILDKTSKIQNVLNDLQKIPNITVAYVTAGTYSVFCKIRAKDTNEAKDVLYKIDEIDGVERTETTIAFEEIINDRKRLMHAIFKEM
ncbi:MAG: winged helix-turn-helix transcriptional regulator [Tenacibaculum sp.]|nr:winged helix-turn-helix transcriptional regulator [Tenacibaculum sp.]